MTLHPHDSPNGGESMRFRRRPVVMALATAVLIGSFYLLREHWGHLLGLWPYLLLLACPLMHLLHGHGGHGHRDHAGHGPEPKRANPGRE